MNATPYLNGLADQLYSGPTDETWQAFHAFTDAMSYFLEQSTKENDSALQQLFAELTPILAQLLEAFEAKDYTLMGDLILYEILPYTEQ